MKTGTLEALFATEELAGLGPETRGGVWTEAEVDRAVAEYCIERRVLGPAAACLKGLVLLWHDHLDAGHAVVQDLEGADAAWVHGIMHRREPDYSNARYWFHRVGNHPARDLLAEAAAPQLAENAALRGKLIRGGTWDALAFIGAVEADARHLAPSAESLTLKELQRLESTVLAWHFAAEKRSTG